MSLETQTAPRRGDWPDGSVLVRTTQPLGTLATVLLEAETEDGLVTWNAFGDDLAPGGFFPVERVEREDDLDSDPVPRRFDVRQDADGVAVTLDGAPFARYRLESGNKPVLAPIHGPDGVRMTRPLPPGPGADHPHHRGLFFGHQSLNGTDVWTDAATYDGDPPPRIGRIRHRTFPEISVRRDRVVLVSANDYEASDGVLILSDVRRLTFHTRDDTRLIDVDLTLIAEHAPVTIADIKDAGLALRMAPSMTVDAGGGGRITTAYGDTDRDAWGTRAPWCDSSGPIDGRTYGIAILDHPTSWHHPTPWHVRTYGLMAANPFGTHAIAGTDDDGTIVLRPGDRIDLHWRIVLHRGDHDAARIDDAYEAYAAETPWRLP